MFPSGRVCSLDILKINIAVNILYTRNFSFLNQVVCFYFLLITVNAAMNTFVHLLVHFHVYFYWVNLQEYNGMGESQSIHISTLVDLATVLYYSSLYFYQQCKRVCIVSHLCQHFLLVLSSAILVSVQCDLIVILIYFPGTKVEYFSNVDWLGRYLCV